MPVSTVTTSAAGSLALLEDDDQDIRVFALHHLLSIIPVFWAEISDKLAYIEALADPLAPELPKDERSYASLLVSKIYYYIGLIPEAVDFALKAGSVFEKEPAGEYRDAVIAGCLDRAIEEVQAGTKSEATLMNVVEGVLRNSSPDGGKLAIGLSLSVRRLDLIEMIYVASRAPSSSSSKPEHDEGLLRYILSEVISGNSGNLSQPPSFREQLFQLLHRLFLLSSKPDYSSITQIWVQSDDPKTAGETLGKLMKEENYAEAYQVAFDLWAMANSHFIDLVKDELEKLGLDYKGTSPDSDDPKSIVDDIILGLKSSELLLNFLSANNKTDMAMLKAVKESVEDRNSIYHSAITFTNAFANCGTASDTFMRENLDWLGRANNWAKFSATAALGIIHRGSWINGSKVVKPYLPGGRAPSHFSEGGALFALGLIYVGRRTENEEILRNALSEGNDPIVQHGAALGLGASAIGSGDPEVYEEMKRALFQDSATAGEGAGYAMGLLGLGTGSEKMVEELLAYAGETQHEKIIRSLAMGVAMAEFGRMEQAENTIAALTKQKDAILRYGGMYAIALAYAGTNDNGAVRRLLHVAVSDVNDDVRRAAVTGLGFVLFRNHTQVPRVVQLLAESYNPHVRHGATLALGISCAGTGLETAIDILEPMTKDPVDFVRQGAYIALSMILIQQTESQNSKVASVRETLSKVVADKRDDPIARFGAAIAQGIIDAGGRNMTLSLSTQAGTLNAHAIVGIALFTQFWYWFPLAHFLGIAFSPTVVIALDDKMRIPKLDFTCNAKPSLFAYPAAIKPKTEKKEKKAPTAVLSTTAKANARAKSKKGDAMDVDDKPAASSTETKADAPAKKDRKAAEPSSFSFTNMTRVTPSQAPLISLNSTRYRPLRPIGDSSSSLPTKKGESSKRGTTASGSVVILVDETPEVDVKEDDYIQLNDKLWPAEGRLPPPEEVVPEPASQTAISEDDDAEVPAAFEYPFDD